MGKYIEIERGYIKGIATILIAYGVLNLIASIMALRIYLIATGLYMLFCGGMLFRRIWMSDKNEPAKESPHRK